MTRQSIQSISLLVTFAAAFVLCLPFSEHLDMGTYVIATEWRALATVLFFAGFSLAAALICEQMVFGEEL